MSTQINIENYESFYLDYLEGNLNEEDSAALLAFLEMHPDLIVEDDALAYLPEAEFVALDNQAKQGLKFPDTEQKIGINNIEIFLIASVENQLSEAKSKELQAFIQANPSYAEELSLYQRSRLQADLSIVFEDKQRMKKGGIIIPMYARFAAAAVAASVVIAFSVFNSGDDQPTQIASTDHKQKQEVPAEAKDPESKKETQEVVHVVKAYDPSADVSQPSAPAQVALNGSTPDPQQPAQSGKTKTSEKEKSVKLKAKPLKTISIIRPLFHNPVTPFEPFAHQPSAQEDNSSYAMVEMKNPIQPITKRISEVIKQDVEFKTSKAAKKRSGGFYLKIGKFELSRKKYENATSVAAK